MRASGGAWPSDPDVRTQTVERPLPGGHSARVPAPHATTSVQRSLRVPWNRRSVQACGTVGTALASPGDPARWRGRINALHDSCVPPVADDLSGRNGCGDPEVPPPAL